MGDPYISWVQLKAVLGITDSAEDALGQRAVLGAAAAINNRCGFPTFWKADSPEVVTVETDGKIVPNRRAGYYKLLLPCGIAEATGFAVSGFATARMLDASALFAEGKPVTEIRLPWGSSIPETIDITCVPGWPAVPPDIIMANQIQAHRYYRRRGSPEGIAGSAEWGLTRIPNLDPDVKSILDGGNYINPGIG